MRQSTNYGNTNEAATPCRREYLSYQVFDCSKGMENVVPAWVYVQNTTQWIPSGAHGGNPSPQYLTSMQENIEQHWCPPGGTTMITIRRADTGKIVEEWSGNQMTSLNSPVNGDSGLGLRTSNEAAWQQYLFQGGLNVQQQSHLSGIQYPEDDY